MPLPYHSIYHIRKIFLYHTEILKEKTKTMKDFFVVMPRHSYGYYQYIFRDAMKQPWKKFINDENKIFFLTLCSNCNEEFMLTKNSRLSFYFQIIFFNDIIVEEILEKNIFIHKNKKFNFSKDQKKNIKIISFNNYYEIIRITVYN